MWIRSGCWCAVALMFAAPAAWADGPLDARGRAGRLQAVRRFAYQLQKFQVDAAARSAADLIVIDPENDGKRLTREQVAAVQKKPDGRRRIALAYLSIGEAEEYRPYWRASWKASPPAWLGAENPDWPGNYKVRYWDPAWQALILGNPAAPLEEIVAAGFDGVYLDIVDGYEFWEERGQADARARMVAWVGTIARTARAANPSFLVVPQNGDALAEEAGYLDQVDAIGREDLFFDGDEPQPAGRIAEDLATLKLFRDAGKPVFLVEYCQAPKDAATVGSRAKAAGAKALVTVRPLDRLIVSP